MSRCYPLSQAQKGSKGLTLSLVVVLVLLTQGLNGPDFGLPGFITGKRVGLILLTLVFLQQRSKPWPRARAISWMILALLLVACWTFVSALVSPRPEVGKFAQPFAWILIAYSLYALDWTFPRVLLADRRRFPAAMAICGGTFALATIAWLCLTEGYGVFFSQTALRLAMQDTSQGMSRYLNGMLFLNAFSIAAALGLIQTTVPAYFLCLAGSAAFALLAALAGSRQTLGAIALYVLVLLAVHVRCFHAKSVPILFPTRRRWLLVALGLLLAVLLTTKVFQSKDIRVSVVNRLFDCTREQFESDDDSRKMVTWDAWLVAKENLWFGVGPLGFIDHPKNRTGLYPHNAYLSQLVSAGLPSLLIVVGTLAGMMLWSARNLRQAIDNGHADMATVTFAFLVVFVLWSVQFNELVREYMLYDTFAMLVFALKFSADQTLSHGDSASWRARTGLRLGSKGRLKVPCVAAGVRQTKLHPPDHARLRNVRSTSTDSKHPSVRQTAGGCVTVSWRLSEPD